MRATILILMLGLLTTIFAGCGEEASPQASTVAGGHAHPHDHPHDEGDDAGHHGGPRHALGSQQVGPYTVEVTQIGEVAAGESATFEIVLPQAAAHPQALRAWVGNEQATGSVKVRTRQRPTFYDADMEVPAPLPDGSRLWVEIETEAGERHLAAFEFASP